MALQCLARHDVSLVLFTVVLWDTNMGSLDCVLELFCLCLWLPTHRHWRGPDSGPQAAWRGCCTPAAFPQSWHRTAQKNSKHYVELLKVSQIIWLYVGLFITNAEWNVKSKKTEMNIHSTLGLWTLSKTLCLQLGCLSVSNSCKNYRSDSHEICRKVVELAKEQPITFWRWSQIL